MPVHVSLFDRSTLSLPVEEGLVSQLGLGPGALMHSTFFVRQEALVRGERLLNESTGAPIATLIGSPVPPVAWDRAIRISFSLPPQHGQLWRLIKALRSLDLFVRRIEADDGFSLPDVQVVVGSVRTAALQRPPEVRGSIRQTVALTIELPRRRDVDDGGEVTVAEWCHRYIASSLRHPPKPAKTLRIKAKLVKQLQKALADRSCEMARVDWLSSLQLLSGLASTLPEGTGLSECAESLRLSAGKSGTIDIPLSKWRKFLDPAARTSIEKSLNPGVHNFAAVTSIDPHERVLISEFVPLRTFALLQFDISFPAGRLEHLWKEWLLSEIAHYGGGVLALSSGARIDGRWGKATVVASFDFTRPPEHLPCPRRIRRILDCVSALRGIRQRRFGGAEVPAEDEPRIAALQGAILGPERFEVAEKVIDDQADVDQATFFAVRDDSTLSAVRLWYRWPDGSTHDYHATFAPAPFNYTRPLSLNRFRKLFDRTLAQVPRSRARLVERITERLLDENDGSVILVGAHRSGKTSLLNMVRSLINLQQTVSGERRPERDAFAIRINAAVTPPHLLLPAIAREVAEAARSKKKKRGAPKMPVRARDAARRLKKALAKQMESFRRFAFAEIDEFEVEFPIPGGKAKAKSKLDPGDEAVLRRLDHEKEESFRDQVARTSVAIARREQQGRWDTSEGRAAFLRVSIACLKAALSELGPNVALVIAMDELSESAAWSDGSAFPVWRQVIESESFSRLRWLFSSTRPPVEALGYSPLSNALREYTMAPLSEEEAHRLLDNFEKVQSDGDEPSDEPLITPILTHDAREFICWATGRLPYLMQVLCVHVYEQSIRYHIPVVSRALTMRILHQRVLPELSDYFRAQWRSLPETEREALAGPIRDLAPGDRADEVLRAPFELPTSVLTARALMRAGLGSPELETSVAPLFACWFRIHDGAGLLAGNTG